MPRPRLPHLAAKPHEHDLFRLEDAEIKYIARTLCIDTLPSDTIASIEGAVTAYRATEQGSQTTTVANVLYALKQLEKKPGRAGSDALQLLANERGAVDYMTHNMLQPLAKAALDGEPGALDTLIGAARVRGAELERHPRVSTSTEPLRFFCGVLRLIFDDVALRIEGTITEEETWQRRRRFALEIFAVAGIDTANFDAHPERLTEYLHTGM